MSPRQGKGRREGLRRVAQDHNQTLEDRRTRTRRVAQDKDQEMSTEEQDQEIKSEQGQEQKD